MTTTTMTFAQFHALGYTRLVPIVPPDAQIRPSSAFAKNRSSLGKAVGVKGRDGLWGGFDWLHYEPDEHDIDRWQRMGAGIGIRTGNGLIAIDADTLDPDHARTIRDAVERHFGRLPVRIGRYPKALYVIRTPDSYRYTRVEFGENERVEVLSDGRQFVAHGIHPVTGNPYHWPRGVIATHDIPSFTASQVDAFMEDLRSALPAAKPIAREGAPASNLNINQESLKGDPEHIRMAVNSIANTNENFETREAYRDFGYAIKAALPDHPDEAFEIFADWCDRWEEGSNDPDTIASDWRRMKPPFRRGAGYIYDLAERVGRGFNRAELWFQPLPEETFLSSLTSGPSPSGASAASKVFAFIPFEQAATEALHDTSRPLIDGLLEMSAMSVLYGDSNAGKTFVALDMTFHIATGQPYANLPSTQGRVAYVAAEGGRGIRKRIAALKSRKGSTDAFFLLASPIDLRRPDADLKPLLHALTDLKPSIVVLDTLSRVMAGGDENSSVDMGILVKHFDAIRAATEAHLLVIHHTGKDKARGARGHSLLRAATDTEIEVADGMIAVTKQRDLEKDWKAAFRLEGVALGVDAASRPLSSAVVVLSPVAEKQAAESDLPDLTDQEERLLACLRRLADAEGTVSVDDAAMVDGNGRDDLSRTAKGKARFHLRNLTLKGWIKKSKRGRWAILASRSGGKVPSTSVSDDLSSGKVEENGGKSGGNIFE